MYSNFKWFVPYFAFVSVYEFANLLNWLVINHTNSWAANIMELTEFILFTYLMTSLAKRASYKKKVYLFAVIVILLSFIDMFFVQGIWKLNTIALVLQDLFILTLIYTYYHDLLKEATEGLVLLKYPPFLVVTGLLFYFLSKSLFYSCFSFMVYKNNYHFYILAATIPGLSNLLLNSILIYAFLCFSKTKKLSL
jgi:hypothetical protein